MDKHDLQVELALEAEAIGWLLLSSPEPGAAAGGGGGGAGGCFRPSTDPCRPGAATAACQARR